MLWGCRRNTCQQGAAAGGFCRRAAGGSAQSSATAGAGRRQWRDGDEAPSPLMCCAGAQPLCYFRMNQRLAARFGSPDRLRPSPRLLGLGLWCHRQTASGLPALSTTRAPGLRCLFATNLMR